MSVKVYAVHTQDDPHTELGELEFVDDKLNRVAMNAADHSGFAMNLTPYSSPDEVMTAHPGYVLTPTRRKGKS